MMKILVFVMDNVINSWKKKEDLGNGYSLFHNPSEDEFSDSVNDATSAHVAITGNCNLSCKGCYANKQIWEMPVEMYKSLLDIGQLNAIEFTFGEPTLHPDLIQLADLTAAEFNKLIIATNGINSDVLERLVEKKIPGLEIHLSIDPYHAEQYQIKDGDLIATARELRDLASANRTGFDFTWRGKGSDFVKSAAEALGYDPEYLQFFEDKEWNDSTEPEDIKDRRKPGIIYVGPHGLIYDNDYDFMRARKHKAVALIEKKEE